MKKRLVLVASLIAVACFVVPAVLSRDRVREPTDPGDLAGAPAEVRRGAYLVHHVAMCAQCHSGRDLAGDLIPDQILAGGRMPVAAPFPGEQWAFSTPPLAGLPSFSRDQLVHLLTRGTLPDGSAPLPPMPPFRMTEEDAKAVAAYLESLR